MVLAAAVICCLATTAASAQEVPLPAVSGPTFNVEAFGAVGDGRTLSTAAIQKTIDAAVAAGGGTVVIPAGRFLTGPLTLASNINFHLTSGAVLLITDDLATYPKAADRFQDAISADHAHDIEITGRGTIDGQGQQWWATFRADPSMMHRPFLIRLRDCTRVLVEGVTLRDSPMFHLVPEDCTDVTIRDVTIEAPADSPNTDGIDPSGWNYLITGCSIDVGDDDIAVKTAFGRSPGDRNFTITDCRFLHGHGLSIGSGTSGGIEGLTARDCTFDGTEIGIRIKTSRGHGGRLSHLSYERIAMTDVGLPIDISDWYPEHGAPADPSSERPRPLDSRTPENSEILIKDLTATGAVQAGLVRGLPEAPIRNLTLDNVAISAVRGMTIYFATGVTFNHSKISVREGSLLQTFRSAVTGAPGS